MFLMDNCMLHVHAWANHRARTFMRQMVKRRTLCILEQYCFSATLNSAVVGLSDILIFVLMLDRSVGVLRNRVTQASVPGWLPGILCKLKVSPGLTSGLTKKK